MVADLVDLLHLPLHFLMLYSLQLVQHTSRVIARRSRLWIKLVWIYDTVYEAGRSVFGRSPLSLQLIHERLTLVLLQLLVMSESEFFDDTHSLLLLFFTPLVESPLLVSELLLKFNWAANQVKLFIGRLLLFYLGMFNQRSLIPDFFPKWRSSFDCAILLNLAWLQSISRAWNLQPSRAFFGLLSALSIVFLWIRFTEFSVSTFLLFMLISLGRIIIFLRR